MLSDYVTELRERCDRWWQGTNDGPLLNIIFPRDGAVYPGDAAKPWMSPYIRSPWTGWQHEFVVGQAVDLAARHGDLGCVDEAAGLLERYAEATDRAADGFHFLYLNLGSSMMSAFLTGVTHFGGDTIWLEMEHELTLDQILALPDDVESDYARTALAAIDALTRRLQGRFIFAPPELGGVLDVLAAMRKTMNLLTDTALEPEKVDACVDKLRRIYWRWRGRLDAIIAPRNNGCYTEATRVPSGLPFELGTADFSAMISPDAFSRWVSPHLVDQAERNPGRVYYHLDGPGELPHLDQILAIPGIRVVQWVMTGGVPGGMEPVWDDLYRRILDAGKRVALVAPSSDPAQVKAFFRRFPATEFQANYYLSSAQQAREVLGAVRG